MDLLDLAARAARDAGALLIERYRQPVRGLETKSSATDMVSEADCAAEDAVVAMIRRERPGDAIFGEEGGDRTGDTGLRWIVDPLDGTTNFLYRIPQWCVSVAVEDADGALAGVVHDPLRDETFAAARGSGATCNGEPIAASALTDVSTALVATGFGYGAGERAKWGSVVVALLPQVRDVRRGGAAALDLAWCAAGRVDAYAEIPCSFWDRAAGALIAREAGCVVTTLPPLGPAGEGALAAPPALHDALRELIDAAL
ncbi:MAG: inositol monophosphatase family protein [Actinomycetota bacterium]